VQFISRALERPGPRLWKRAKAYQNRPNPELIMDAMMNSAARLSRYMEKALDLSSVIVAIAKSRVDPDSLLSTLAERRNSQLVDYLHEFAYAGRKALEAAWGVGFPRDSSQAKRIVGHELPSNEPRDYNLEFVLNRIIHSSSLVVDQVALEFPSNDETPWGFIVRSDRDGHDEAHFVFVEFLIEDFLRVSADVQAYTSEQYG
jgi:hypothetical protein